MSGFESDYTGTYSVICNTGLNIPGSVFRFCFAMNEALGSGFNMLEFIEKPWHWDAQFMAWREADEPVDRFSPGWLAFKEGL